MSEDTWKMVKTAKPTNRTVQRALSIGLRDFPALLAPPMLVDFQKLDRVIQRTLNKVQQVIAL